MGGRNHQPCGKYLRESAQLSQELSRLVVACEEVNVQVEEIILGELTVDECRSRNGYEQALLQSQRAGTLVIAFFRDLDVLVNKMDALNFQDSPSAESLEAATLEEALISQGMIVSSYGPWYEILAIWQKGGFRAVFEQFGRQFQVVAAALNEVNAVLESARASVEEGIFNQAVERNQLPFRQAYSRLAMTLTVAVEEFRCSSLLSTELHFMDNGHSTFIGDRVSAVS